MYLAHKEKVESTLRWLHSLGLDTSTLWQQHEALIQLADTETIHPLDTLYELPADRPSVLDHFIDGRPEPLVPSKCWAGYSYSLSPGQRGWLRDVYGLTPTATVTVHEVSPWPGTRHPRMIHLRSDLHVDPRNRRHVLVSAVIREPGKFWSESAERDAATQDVTVKDDGQVTTGPKVKKPRRGSLENYLNLLEEDLKP